jgi:hypothetical protein
VLDWGPVPGAVRYDLRVSTDDQFASSNIIDSRTVKGTRYSPLTTYNVDDYWWQVRAIDPIGIATSWSAAPGLPRRHTLARGHRRHVLPVDPGPTRHDVPARRRD